MTIDDKLERLADVVAAQAANIDRHQAVLDRHEVFLAQHEASLGRLETSITRLEGVVNTLATTVFEHDDRIKALLKSSERHERIWKSLEKQWQAYLNTLPKN